MTRIQISQTRLREKEERLLQQTRPGGSWAQVAGGQQQQCQAGPVPFAIAARGPRVAPAKKLDNAKMRRVTVKIHDIKEREEALKADREDLVRKFRNAANEATKDIVAAFTKPSGEVVLVTATVEAREALEEKKEWATVGYPSAEIKRQTFPAIVHGVRRAAVDIEKQDSTIAKIIEANRVLHPTLQVERVWWSIGASRPNRQGNEKIASSLILELITPEAVNEVVKKGLVGAGSLLTCERWERKPAILQCFRCSEYGHMTYRCPNPVRCGECSGKHDTREHHPDNKISKCAVCGGGHPAWSLNCPNRVAEARGRQRLGRKPRLYDVTGLRAIPRKEPERDTEGFITVVNKPSKKRKADTVEVSETQRPPNRPPGRPLGRPRILSYKEDGQSTLPSSLRRAALVGGRSTWAENEPKQMQKDSRSPISTQ